jgi:hypothetical protein
MAVDALAGVVWSSPLVRDEIVAPLTVAPQIAPSLMLGGGFPLDGRHRLGVRIGWARSDLVRTEQDETTAILPLTTWSGSVVLERLMIRQVAAEARLGGIKYAPGGDANGTIFQDDAPFAPLLGLGVRAWQPIGGRVVIGLQLAYDFHRFETQALKSGGFTSARSVHRLTVSANLRWSAGRATP